MISLPHTHINEQITSAIMTLLFLILIAIPAGILAILLWMYIDYKKYKKRHNLIVLLLLLFPTTLTAQYIDNDCRISFKWYENQKGKLEYRKDKLDFEFIPSSTNWEIIIRNTSSEEALVNWRNTQFIINGRASEIDFTSPATEDSYQSIIKSNTEVRRTVIVSTTTAKNKKSRKIYDSKSIRKGNRAAITIILPIAVGKQPQFYNTFDFVVTQIY